MEIDLNLIRKTLKYMEEAESKFIAPSTPLSGAEKKDFVMSSMKTFIVTLSNEDLWLSRYESLVSVIVEALIFASAHKVLLNKHLKNCCSLM